jgi:hypothetical protein
MTGYLPVNFCSYKYKARCVANQYIAQKWPHPAGMQVSIGFHITVLYMLLNTEMSNYGIQVSPRNPIFVPVIPSLGKSQ